MLLKSIFNGFFNDVFNACHQIPTHVGTYSSYKEFSLGQLYTTEFSPQYRSSSWFYFFIYLSYQNKTKKKFQIICKFQIIYFILHQDGCKKSKISTSIGRNFYEKNYLIFVSVGTIRGGGACSAPKFTASVDRKLIWFGCTLTFSSCVDNGELKYL